MDDDRIDMENIKHWDVDANMTIIENSPNKKKKNGSRCW
jgi:hypothetical protein